MLQRSCFFFFNDTATTEIYTLSLHDALPIYRHVQDGADDQGRNDSDGDVALGILGFLGCGAHRVEADVGEEEDRKSTRLNSSHLVISYAVFCLKKKNVSFNIDYPSLATSVPT